MTTNVKTYDWIPGTRYKGDAQVAGEEIEKILPDKRMNRELARSVVKKARAKRSVLHGYFEWDDSIAAEEYRINQAMHLVAAVRLVNPDEGEDERPQRAFVTIRVENGGFGYYTLDEILSDDALRKRRYQELYARADCFARIARDFAEFAPMMREFDRIPPPEGTQPSA